MSLICLGFLFALSVSGQEKEPQSIKTKSPEKPMPETRRKNDDLECDFSSYNTIQATPLIKRQVKAAYPKAAERKKIAGVVRIKVLINKEGKVEQACAVEGHKLLIPSALKAVKLWEFSKSDVQKNLERMQRDYFESIIIFRITAK